MEGRHKGYVWISESLLVQNSQIIHTLFPHLTRVVGWSRSGCLMLGPAMKHLLSTTTMVLLSPLLFIGAHWPCVQSLFITETLQLKLISCLDGQKIRTNNNNNNLIKVNITEQNERSIKHIKNCWKTTRLKHTTTKVELTPLTSFFIKDPC